MRFLVSIFLFSILISSTVGIVCPRGFSAVNNQKCLRAFTNNLKHLEAETDCSYLGGTLVTIKNAVDNRGVANLAGLAGANNVWIGMFCFATGNTTTCYHDDNSGVVSYKSFASGNPVVQGNGGCIYMSTSGKTSGQWYSAPCEVIGMPFICEVPQTVADATCTHNYNGYCYYPSSELTSGTTSTTYQKAQAICQSMGANMVSIHSKPEIDYIRALFLNSGVTNIFLGAQAFLPDTFDWVDGSHWDFDYTNPLSYVKGSCLQMDLSNRPNNGLWSETNCQLTNSFLCKRKISGAVAASTPQPVAMTTASRAEVGERVNPKFHNALPRRQELLDFSNCNTTLYMAPGLITSFGYPNTKPPATYCTWKVVSLGPYRVALYFTDFSVYNPLYIYDEFGNLITSPGYNQSPFSVLGPTNIVTLKHDSSYDGAYNYHGFSATVLPY